MPIDDQFPMLKALHAEGPAPDQAAQWNVRAEFFLRRGATDSPA